MRRAASNTDETWLKAKTILEARIAVEGSKANDLRMVMDMLDELRASSATSAPAREASVGRKRRSAKGESTISHYKAEFLGGEEVLAEYRTSAVDPFRCPRVIYERVVKFLAASKSPVEFMDLFDELRRSDSAIPDYRPRVCLRFLVGRRILKHVRRRFERTGEPKDFERRAMAAWDAARRQAQHPLPAA